MEVKKNTGKLSHDADSLKKISKLLSKNFLQFPKITKSFNLYDIFPKILEI